MNEMFILCRLFFYCYFFTSGSLIVTCTWVNILSTVPSSACFTRLGSILKQVWVTSSEALHVSENHRSSTCGTVLPLVARRSRSCWVVETYKGELLLRVSELRNEHGTPFCCSHGFWRLRTPNPGRLSHDMVYQLLFLFLTVFSLILFVFTYPAFLYKNVP